MPRILKFVPPPDPGVDRAGDVARVAVAAILDPSRSGLLVLLKGRDDASTLVDCRDPATAIELVERAAEGGCAVRGVYLALADDAGVIVREVPRGSLAAARDIGDLWRAALAGVPVASPNTVESP